MIIVGIDPGQKGAIAFFRATDDKTIHHYEVSPLPYEDFKEGGKILNSRELNHMIEEWDIMNIKFIIEKAQSMSDQGVKSIFNYGRDFGMIIAICQIYNKDIEFVHPATWKSKFKLFKKGKEASIELAKEWFPAADLLPIPRCRKDSDGMAEALLIAEYGRRYLLES